MVAGNPMYVLIHRLRNVKAALRVWSRARIGNVSSRVEIGKEVWWNIDSTIRGSTKSRTDTSWVRSNEKLGGVCSSRGIFQ